MEARKFDRHGAIAFRSGAHENEYSLTVQAGADRVWGFAKSDLGAIRFMNDNGYLWVATGTVERGGEDRFVYIGVKEQGLIIDNAVNSAKTNADLDRREGVFMRNFNFSEKYLVQRETGAFREQRAYRKLTELIDTFQGLKKTNAQRALKTLRKAHDYQAIFKAVAWVLENGKFPDRSPCLFPFAWLAAEPGRMRDVLHRESAEQVRKHMAEWRRELISEREREKRRAEAATRQAIQRFTREYPTEPEQRRAMIRVYNLHREKFGTLALGEPAAIDLCIGLLVFEIEASSLAQARLGLAG